MLTSYEFTKFLLEAEELKRNGKKKRQICKELCHKYKVGESQLNNRWKKYESEKIQPHHKKTQNVLSCTDEAALVTLLKAASLLSKGVHKRDVLTFVRDRYRNGDPSFRADKWFNKFIERNKDVLKVTDLKVCAPQRIADSTVDSCEEFMQILSELQENLHPDNIINVDESQLKVTGWSARKNALKL